jgi:hypothetical protein
MPVFPSPAIKALKFRITLILVSLKKQTFLTVLPAPAPLGTLCLTAATHSYTVCSAFTCFLDQRTNSKRSP